MLAALLTPLVAGCSEELGAESLSTASVAGTLRLGPKPVGPGWIEFLPVNGTVGNLRSAPLAADGTFAAEGVAVGENQIGILIPRDRELSDYFHLLSRVNRVRRKIPPGRSTLTIDLLEAYAGSDSR